MGRLERRVALVTGAGRGIGQAIALALAREGADVAVLDLEAGRARRVAAEVDKLGRKSCPLACDVADTEATRRAVAEATEALGAVGLLVNNAGVGDGGKEFLDLTRADWDRILGVCLYGTLNANRAVLPYMIERGFGRIVSIGSDAGRVGEPRMSVYSAAKAAVIGHSKALAKEVGPKGITVNVVCPGATETERTMENRAAREQVMGKEKAQAWLEKARRNYPLRRFAQPEDIVGAVLFFCSDEGGFVTGQTLSVSGGYCMV